MDFRIFIEELCDCFFFLFLINTGTNGTNGQSGQNHSQTEETAKDVYEEA